MNGSVIHLVRVVVDMQPDGAFWQEASVCSEHFLQTTPDPVPNNTIDRFFNGMAKSSLIIFTG